jgi:hypothetical protein
MARQEIKRKLEWRGRGWKKRMSIEEHGKAEES